MGVRGLARRLGRWRFALLVLVAVTMTALVAGLIAVRIRAGAYGWNVMLRRGMTTWSPTGPTDPRLSLGVRLGLSLPVPAATPGVLRWREAGPGLEVAELVALVGGREVDSLLLTRIDPRRYRFRVLTRPAGDRDLGDWLSATSAAVVVNGGYFADDGSPDTPVISAGVPGGPQHYRARHGAFVAAAGPVPSARVVDLAGTSWQQAFTGADDAVVSYPMLIGADGIGRAAGSEPLQLANRSFIGEDRLGRIVVGTTSDGFFSLARLSDFLRAAPLELATALNLDGGPQACQAVRPPGASRPVRDFCGTWETTRHGDRVELLGSLFGHRRFALPEVIVATPVPSTGG